MPHRRTCALTTFECADLPETERPILPWARETVWYVPEEVQAATRRLHDQLGRTLTLDAIGTAALANASVLLAMLTG